MNKRTKEILLVSLFLLAAIPAISQLQLAFTVDEQQTCKVEFYDDQDVTWEDCSTYEDVQHCTNSSGPNTGCSTVQRLHEKNCRVTNTVTRNRTLCTPDHVFEIEIDDGVAIARKQLDSSDFGPCGYEEAGGCLEMTCVSYDDGAHNGEFVGCRSGMSCQKFEICDGSVKQYVRNSRDDFAESDVSFLFDRLALKEVGK